MNSNWYRSLFELIIQMYKTNLFSYYFDLPFEETLNRHKTRPKCNDFGEEDMRRWWIEKDFSDLLNEYKITADKDKNYIVSEIYNHVLE